MQFFKLDSSGVTGTSVKKKKKAEIPLLANTSNKPEKSGESYEKFSDMVDEGEFDEF